MISKNISDQYRPGSTTLIKNNLKYLDQFIFKMLVFVHMLHKWQQMLLSSTTRAFKGAQEQKKINENIYHLGTAEMYVYTIVKVLSSELSC